LGIDSRPWRMISAVIGLIVDARSFDPAGI
jgi:hypothetical protein